MDFENSGKIKLPVILKESLNNSDVNSGNNTTNDLIKSNSNLKTFMNNYENA